MKNLSINLGFKALNLTLFMALATANTTLPMLSGTAVLWRGFTSTTLPKTFVAAAPTLSVPFARQDSNLPVAILPKPNTKTLNAKYLGATLLAGAATAVAVNENQKAQQPKQATTMPNATADMQKTTLAVLQKISTVFLSKARAKEKPAKIIELEKNVRDAEEKLAAQKLLIAPLIKNHTLPEEYREEFEQHLKPLIDENLRSFFSAKSTKTRDSYGNPQDIFLSTKNLLFKGLHFDRFINAIRLANVIKKHNLTCLSVAKKHLVEVNGHLVMVVEKAELEECTLCLSQQEVEQLCILAEETGYVDWGLKGGLKALNIRRDKKTGKLIFIDTENRSFGGKTIKIGEDHITTEDVAYQLLNLGYNFHIRMTKETYEWLKAHYEKSIEQRKDVHNLPDRPEYDNHGENSQELRKYATLRYWFSGHQQRALEEALNELGKNS